jgi:hypothetical protein
MQVKDTKIFDISVGMDQDTYGSETERGSWFYALNVLFYSGLQGKNKVASNAIGNTEIVNSGLLNLSWKPFGSALDKENGDVFIFLKEPTSSTFQIWRLDNYGTYTLVLSDINLNFLSQDEVKGINVVDGRLYWVDPFFESFLLAANGQPLAGNPKMLIIEKAVRYTQSGGTDPLGYPSIDYQTLSALKFPPAYSPEFVYDSDPNFLQNFHWKKTYQFMYRYVYDDKSKSLFSSMSELAAIFDNERMDGKNVLDVTTDNVIKLSINSGHHTVTDIEIAVRESNSGNWGVFKKINKAEESIGNDVIITVDFYNNENQETVSDIDLFNYDLLPDVALEQQYTTANTIVYGGIRESYDNPEQDIDTKWIPYKIEGNQFSYGVPFLYNYGPDPLRPLPYPTSSYCEISFPLETVHLPVGSLITFRIGSLNDCSSIDGGFQPVFYSYTIQEGDFVGATDLIKLYNMLFNMYNYLITTFPESGVSWVTNAILFTCHRVIGLPIYSARIIKEKTFKQGCFHNVGIVYKKSGQKDGGVVSNQYKVYLPYGSEELPSGFTTSDFYSTLMRLSVNNQPPDWADTWCPVLMERSGMGAQVQRTIMGGGVIDQRVRLDLEMYYTPTYNVGYDYTIEKGDVIRIIQTCDFVEGKAVWSQPSADLQLSIIEYQAGGGTSGTDAIFVEMFDLREVNLRGALIEISKVKKSSETYPYYEVGQEFPIINPHTPERRHGGGDIYSGEVVVGGGIGQAFIEFVGNIFLYEDLVGRGMFLTNVFNETQAVVITGISDFTTTIRIVFTPVCTFNFTQANGGTFRISADQTNTLPAQVLLNGIDVYLRTKIMGTYGAYPIGNFVIEDDSLSNYFPSQDYDKGRAHFYNSNQSQRNRYNLLRGSLPYSEGTEVNQLNRFIPGEEAQGVFDHGKITGLYMRGETLRVLQERKVFSIPIKRQVGVLPGGGSQYLFSDAQLGPQDAGTPKQGPFKSEATLMIDSNIYYLDVLSKQVMNDTLGGSFPLNGKLNQFWVTVCKQIIQNLPFISVRMGYSEATKELLITVFIDPSRPSGNLNFTIGLDVRTDKWTSFYSFVPDMYVRGDERLYVVKKNAGTLWEHAVGAANTFFGVEHGSRLAFITSPNSEQDKRLLSAFLASNIKPTSTIITSDPTNIQPNGIYSEMSFEERNDGFFAFANMNGSTPGFSDYYVALAEGWPCQAPWFKIDLTTPEGEAFVIRFVDLYFNLIHEKK